MKGLQFLLATISILFLSECSPVYNPNICPNCPKQDGTIDKIICIDDAFDEDLSFIVAGVNKATIEKTNLIPKTFTEVESKMHLCSLTIIANKSYSTLNVSAKNYTLDKDKRTLWLFTDKLTPKEMSLVVTEAIGKAAKP